MTSTSKNKNPNTVQFVDKDVLDIGAELNPNKVGNQIVSNKADWTKGNTMTKTAEEEASTLYTNLRNNGYGNIADTLSTLDADAADTYINQLKNNQSQYGSVGYNPINDAVKIGDAKRTWTSGDNLMKTSSEAAKEGYNTLVNSGRGDLAALLGGADLETAQNIMKELNPTSEDSIYYPIDDNYTPNTGEDIINRYGFIKPNYSEYLSTLDEAVRKKYDETAVGIDKAAKEYAADRSKTLGLMRQTILNNTSEHVINKGTAGQLAAALSQIGIQAGSEIGENFAQLAQDKIQNEAQKQAELADNPTKAMQQLNSIANTLATIGNTADANVVQNLVGLISAISGIEASKVYGMLGSKYGMMGNIYAADKNLEGNKYVSDNNLKETEISVAARGGSSTNTTPTGTPTKLKGDLNGDGKLSETELKILNGTELQETYDNAYANGDLKIAATAYANKNNTTIAEAEKALKAIPEFRRNMNRAAHPEWEESYIAAYKAGNIDEAAKYSAKLYEVDEATTRTWLLRDNKFTDKLYKDSPADQYPILSH